jgi:hypothetical protein
MQGLLYYCRVETKKIGVAHPYPAMKYENILLGYYDIILLFLNAAEFYITYGDIWN